MALTKRKSILDELVYRYGLVNPANGYSLAISTVTLQRDTESDPYSHSELPAINIEPGETTVTQNTSYSSHQMPVTIAIYTSSEVSVSDAEDLLEAAASCANLNKTWGGNAITTSISSHKTDLKQLGDIIEPATLEIEIMYYTGPGEI